VVKVEKIKVDPEFKSQIPPLSDGEKALLEESILANGCRDALVVWEEERILLDGHNRYDICTRLKIDDFDVKEISLPDRRAAMVWIIKNQVGRRNLSESQRSMCAAKLANLEHGGDRSKGSIDLLTSQAKAAEQFNVSVPSLKRAKTVLEKGAAELIKAVTKDEIAVSVAAEIAELPKADQVDVLEKGKSSMKAAVKEIKKKKAKARKVKRAKQKAAAVAENHPLKGKSFKLLAGDLIKAGEEIADESVDTIITDPPYKEEFLEVYPKLAQLAGRVLVKGGHCLVMVGQAHLPRVLADLGSSPDLTYHWTIAYLTPGQSTQVFGRKVKSNWKPIIWLIKGKNTWEHVEDSIKSDENDKRFHEWGQSVGGIAQLIERFTVPKSLILDPFVGGGSTAIAALKLDRLFVGIDIDKACIQETAGRIKTLRNDD
jgi:ParB-like chromosome segregation protein Spo0J